MKKVFTIFLIVSALFLTGCDDSDRDVSISLPAGQYYGEQHVTLSCPDPTAQITYTLDGSDPGESLLVYDPETGIDINYTSDLKATAGGNVAEAHYDIVPYDTPMDPTQKGFYDKITGDWATDENLNDTVKIGLTTLIIEVPGQEPIRSGYFIKDVNGDGANIVYTDAAGTNVTVPVSVNTSEQQLNFNGKVYVPTWMFY